MNLPEKLDAHQKALRINLDGAKYGTFAEIGAGQEVANWFFRAGGAAGTVAKTISAYDMTVSDAIYGPCQRYVSRKRLVDMLAYEYKLLLERLDEKRGQNTHFFAFANTVTARSYSHADDGVGWLGIRFQQHPRAEPSQIIIHVLLRDRVNVQEQEALGIVGVNLVYGALFLADQPLALMDSLLDSLTRARIEIDMIKFEGPAFAGVDNRLMSLELVRKGLTDATMFTTDGEAVHISDVLYKKPILVERGSFRPVTNLTVDLIHSARAQMLREFGLKQDELVTLMEITMHNLLEDGRIDSQDFLDRVDLIGALGRNVLVSNYGEFYLLIDHLWRYHPASVGIAMGVPALRELMDGKYYADLPGGLLEAMGRLFKRGVKIYAYPEKRGNRLLTPDGLEVAAACRHLYAHLLAGRLIEGIEGANKDYLDIHAPEVLAMIQRGDERWESMVPPQVAGRIKERGLLGYRPRRQAVSKPA
jgi:hypothetical protein